MINNLEGKKAIVTGGAMGFGLATCTRLVREGCDVTIWDLSPEALKEAESSLNKIGGGRVYTYVCDVSNKQTVFDLIEQARKDMGRIDILINNAGFFRPGNFWERPLEHAERQMEVNMNALLYSTYAVLPEMIERNSGHIVNLASGGSFFAIPGWVAYCASKYAVYGFTEALRIELKAAGKTGIKVTSVHPGHAVKGMFEGVNFGPLASRLMPSMESHDIVAEAIVNKALKKGRSIVCRPRQVYLIRMMRGLIPNSVWDRLLLYSGASDALRSFRGRPGFVHTDSAADRRSPVSVETKK